MSCTCKYGGGPAGVCFECKSRRAFNARLKKLEDAKASEDYARGVAVERARVVADLRAMNPLIYPSARFLAGRYERGEHDKPVSRMICVGCQGKGGSFEPSIAHTDMWVVCDVCGGRGGRGEHDKEGT